MGYLIMGEIKDREHEKRGIEQKKTPTISFSILPKKDTNSTEHICSKSTKGDILYVVVWIHDTLPKLNKRNGSTKIIRELLINLLN